MAGARVRRNDMLTPSCGDDCVRTHSSEPIEGSGRAMAVQSVINATLARTAYLHTKTAVGATNKLQRGCEIRVVSPWRIPMCKGRGSCR